VTTADRAYRRPAGDRARCGAGAAAVGRRELVGIDCPSHLRGAVDEGRPRGRRIGGRADGLRGAEWCTLPPRSVGRRRLRRDGRDTASPRRRRRRPVAPASTRRPVSDSRAVRDGHGGEHVPDGGRGDHAPTCTFYRRTAHARRRSPAPAGSAPAALAKAVPSPVPAPTGDRRRRRRRGSRSPQVAPRWRPPRATYSWSYGSISRARWRRRSWPARPSATSS